MKSLHTHPLISMLLAVVAFSCGSGGSCGEIFDKAEKLIAVHPDSATSYLESLAADTVWTKAMRESDRARFSLLRVKAADKAYVRHTSDSLIRSALAYYENHTGSDHYPEALYYGGRIYSDLGDSPTALRYFQTALDAVPDNEENRKLRCHILSQTGRLLNSLRLYDKAIPYIEEVISLESQDSDKKNLVYNLELLGAINFHMNNYDISEKQFLEALNTAKPEWTAIIARQKMYLAAIKRERGYHEEALSLIRGVPESINDDYYGTALGYAARIYLQSEKTDTAYMYAFRLAYLEKGNNQKGGMQLLLSPELICMLPQDSVLPLVRRYSDIMENFVNKNGDHRALMQDAFYNYSLHEKERAESDRQKLEMQKKITVVLCIAVLLLVLVFYFAIRSKNNKIKLHEAINELRTLKAQLMPPSSNSESKNEENEKLNDENAHHYSLSTHDLQNELRREWLEIYNTMTDPPVISNEILASDAYKELVSRIGNEKNVPSNSPLWKEIEQAILNISPDFDQRLKILMGRKPKTDEYHLVLLIKCGISSTQSAKLFSVVKSAVNYRRKILAKSLFGSEDEVKALDYIIRSL